MSDQIPADSKRTAAAAIRIALTTSREEEKDLSQHLLADGIHSAAVDFGGEFIASVSKIVERGAVAGAAREAVSQIINKAIGLNVGGKIGIARWGDHVGVCVFFGIGLLHLNEIAIGLGHRVI